MNENDHHLEKILLIRFSSLGDIVMMTPLIRNLRKRFPHARIDMVVRADFLDLISHNPHLDGKMALDRGEGFRGLWRLYQKIREERYDLIYDAHRSLRTRLMMPFLPSTHKAYYTKQYIRRSIALTFKLPLLRNSPRMMNRYIDPMERYGVTFDGAGPEVFVDDDTQKFVSTQYPLLRASSENRELRVGLIPSAQWPGKRWPLSHFRRLMEQLVENTPHRYFVFGGKEDLFCGDLVRELPPDRVINLQGKISIIEAAAALQHCDVAIANDTGLMHLADAVKIPCVLILGPTSREMGCLPFHPQSVVVEKHLWCRPCSKNGQAPCIRRERYCLTTISPEEVFLSAKALFQQVLMA